MRLFAFGLGYAARRILARLPGVEASGATRDPETAGAWRRDGVVSILHTETPVEARGQGIASKLVAGALDIIRARGLKMVPRCAFVRAYVAKHPEISDLVA